MNRKLKRIWRSATALCMAFVMMFSTCGTVFAEGEMTGGVPSEEGPVMSEDTIKYVSLGDSMTNGYGLAGYQYNGYLQDVPESYPAKFAEYLKNAGTVTVDHTPLAMSAMRAEDLHFILEFDYENEEVVNFAESTRNWGEFNEEAWNSVFTTGDEYTWDEFVDRDRFNETAYDSFGKGYGAGTANVARTYQEAVADADIVSVGAGNANMGVFLLGRIMNAIGFGNGDDSWIKLENALRECEPEVQTEVMNLYNELRAKLVSDELPTELVDAMVNAIVYTMVSYMLNYAGVIDAIVELNPDVEIMIVGLMNTMNGMDFTCGGETYDLGEYMYGALSYMNAYLAGLPTALQAAGKYPEATFYYAEASNVDVMVNNYKDTIKGEVKTTRERFITEIVGTANDPGMVWKLLSPMVVSMVSGARLEYIDLADIEAYEKMSNKAKAGLAAADKNQAISCALYLAFENAIVESSTGATMSFEGLMALGNLSDSLFDGVMSDFSHNIATNGAKYTQDAFEAVAEISGNMVTADDVKALVVGTKTIIEIVESKLNAAQKTLINRMHNDGGVQKLIEDHSKTVVSCDSQYCKKIYTEVNDQIQMLETAISNIDTLCMLLALPETMSDALQSDEMIFGLLNMFARCLIGDGLGAHPSAAGHVTLSEAVINAYKDKYTAKDATIKNALAALEIISDVVAEYYDEAYAYAYDYAEAEGYIAGASAALDEVNAALDEVAAWVAANGDISGEYEATILKEIEDAKATIEALKDLINNADELDNETYEKAVALLDSLYPHLTNISQLLDTAAGDLTEAAKAELEKLGKAVWAEYLAAKEYIEENLPDALEKAYDFIVEKAGDAFEALADAAAQAVAEYGPEAVAWVYDYLLNNPAEVIAFFNEYGDDAMAFVEEYQNEIFAVLGFLVSTFGNDVVDYVMENPEEVLKTMCELVQEYGDEAWALIVVYAKELGLTEKMPTTEDIKNALDTIYDLLKEYGPDIYDWAEKEGYIDALEAAVEALKKAIEDEIQDYIENARPEIEKAIEELKAELAALEAQLEALKAKLENASDELKAEIKAAIEMIEAKIAEIEAAIEALEAKLAQIAEELNTLYEAIVELAEAIAELIDISTGKLEGDFNAAIEKVQNAYDKVVAAIEAAKELAEVVNAVMTEAAELAEEIAEQIAALKAAACEALEAIKDDIAAGAEELISQYEEELQAIKDALEAIGEEVWAEAQAKIAELQAALEEEIAALKEALEEEIAALKAKAEEQIAALKAAAEAEIAKIKAELEAKIAELQEALEKAAEEAKAEILAQIEALKAEAEAKIAEIQAALEAEIEAILAEVEAQIEALKAEVEAKVAEITAAVEEQIAKIIAEAEAKIAELKTAAEEAAKVAIAELEAAIAEVKAAAEELIAEVEAAVQEILNAVDAQIAAAAEVVIAEATQLAEEAIAFVEEKINEVIAAYEEAYIGATTGEYTVSEDSYYVSIGDSAVTGLGLGKNEVPFGDRLAEALGLDTETQFAQLGLEGMRAEDLRYILDETYVPDAYGTAVVGDDAASLRSTYEAEIAKADLITVGIGSDNISLFVTAQLQRALAGRKLYDMDWNRYLGEAGTAYVMEELEGIRADLKESGLDDFTAGLVVTAVESYAYGYVGFAFNYTEALNRIHEINPEALVIVVGTFNPIDDMVIDVNGTEVAIGDLADGLVELSNLHFTIYAMLTPGTTFVTVPDTENFMDEAIAEGEYVDVTMMSYIMALLANEMHANANGHEYIKDRILNALTVNYDYPLGDVNLDGKVTAADVNLLYRYVGGLAELSELQKQIGDVNQDGVVTGADVNLLYRYVGGLASLN